MIEVEVPWPPSANHYYRHVGRRVLISREGRRYRQAVVRLLQGRLTEPLLGRLRVLIRLHPPDRRRRDLDNTQKALLDALRHAGIYGDDSQIDSLEIHRQAVTPDGRVLVTMADLAPASVT